MAAVATSPPRPRRASAAQTASGRRMTARGRTSEQALAKGFRARKKEIERIQALSSELAGQIAIESGLYDGALGIRRVGQENRTPDFKVLFGRAKKQKLLGLKTVERLKGHVALSSVGQARLERMLREYLDADTALLRRICRKRGTTLTGLSSAPRGTRALVTRDVLAAFVGCVRGEDDVLRPTKVDGLRLLLERTRFFIGGPESDCRQLLATGAEVHACWIDEAATIFRVDLSAELELARFSFTDGFVRRGRAGCDPSWRLCYLPEGAEKPVELIEWQSHTNRSSAKVRAIVDMTAVARTALAVREAEALAVPATVSRSAGAAVRVPGRGMRGRGARLLLRAAGRLAPGPASA